MKKQFLLVGLFLFVFLINYAQESLIKEVRVSNLTDTLSGSVGGMAIDGISDIYVADFERNVWRISRQGEVEAFNNVMYGSSGNAIDGQGHVYQSEFFANTISKLYRDGRIEQIAEKLNGPVGLTIFKDTLYVCNYRSNAITKVSKDGKVSDFCSSKLLVGPNGITMGPQGNFYVVNFNDPNVVKIDQKGNASVFTKLPTSTGGHITYLNGNFYITSYADHKILKVNLAGNVIVFAGTGVKGNKNGAGDQAEFSNPNGIVAFRNSLFVNDLFRDPNGGQNHFIIRKIDFISLPNLLNNAFTSGGIEAAKKAYWEYKNHPSYVTDFTEQALNQFGYTQLTAGKKEFALEIFKLNTESYPNSFNVWDSLAEVYMNLGDNKKAIKYYEKSLELNPNNTNASAKIKEMKTK
jgi:hypothetical protein